MVYLSIEDITQIWNLPFHALFTYIFDKVNVTKLVSQANVFAAKNICARLQL